jgi:glycosyltransferase involved in cell wall biosynthesis
MAQALVFPSLYEGFGLPILEAMACGCPVITSKVTSIPEVAGDSVFYVDPYDVDSIAQGMYQIITNPELSTNLRHQGLTRAKKFSWDKTAAGVAQVLDKCLGRC